jgi:endonuclease/exonuclease/phosphatase family metal-dependent hydrolase
LRADFVGIQELEDRILGTEPVSEYLARNLDMHAYRGSTLMRQDAHYGNLLLSKEPAQAMRLHDISMPDREPRGVIEAMYDLLGQRVRVLVTHFGLKAFERRQQVRNLLGIVDGDDPDIDVLTGDFNEWRPASHTVKALKSRFGIVVRRRTWPARRRLLALDGICVSPEVLRHTVRVVDSRRARWASDHLPLVCDLEIAG